MLCGQRVRPPWLLLLLTLVCNSSFPKKKKKNRTQPSVVPFWASLFSRHLLAAQARAAGEARLGPDRALFCVPQGAGQPSCKAVELAQATREAWQRHSMPQHACGALSHAQERPPPLGMPPCSPAQASILRLHVGGLPEGCCA